MTILWRYSPISETNILKIKRTASWMKEEPVARSLRHIQKTEGINIPSGSQTQDPGI
jgi:hypothetical protein